MGETKFETIKSTIKSNRHIILFLGLLLIFNAIFYFVYLSANPPGILSSATFWSYLTTDVSKLINVSLLFPLVIFVIEDKLKIVSILRQTRIERREKDIETHKKRQWDCIEKTFLIWNEIHDLASEVRYYEYKSDGKCLEDFFKEFKILNNKCEELAPFWKFTFKNLGVTVNLKNKSEGSSHKNEESISKDQKGNVKSRILHGMSPYPDSPHLGRIRSVNDTKCLRAIDLFIVFFNVLIDSAVSVAYNLNSDMPNDEKEDLKEALGGIQRGLEAACRYPMIEILYYSSLLSTNNLKEKEQDVNDKSDDAKVQKIIDHWFNQLNFWADIIVCLQQKDTALSYFEGDDVEIFRNKVSVFEDYLKEKHLNKAEFVKLEEHFLKDSFKTLPVKKFQLATEVVYSKELIFELAEILSVNFFAELIQANQRLLRAQEECGYEIKP